MLCSFHLNRCYSDALLFNVIFHRLHQENLEVELASISSYCDSTESTLNQTESEITDTELVNLKRQCAEYMDQINQSTESTQETPGAKQIRFTFEGQNLQTYISNFGELVINMPGTLSGGTRRNSDSSIQEQNGRLERRPRPEAHPADSVFVTSAEIDSLNIESPRGLSPLRRTPQPSTQRQRGNAASTSQSHVYTTETSPSDYAESLSSRSTGTWSRGRSRGRFSVPDALLRPWRPPNTRDRTREAVNSGV